MQLFDVKSVPLSFKNLVEASAGTGKTYSIAILILRFIIEKEKPASSPKGESHFAIEDILIVTFTKAAVVELQDRIRLFIKAGVDYCNGLPIEDVLIQSIIHERSKVESKESIVERLKYSLFRMDEANIMTIHGFAQKMLSEFAFETKQPFATAIQNDITGVLEQYSNEFYRKEITTLPIAILEQVEAADIRGNLPSILSKSLAEKNYFTDPSHYALNDAIEALQKIMKELGAIKEDVAAYLYKNKDAVTESLKAAYKTADAWFAAEMHDIDEFVAKATVIKNEKKAFVKLRDPFWGSINFLVDNNYKIQKAQEKLIDTIYAKALQELLPQIKVSMQQAGILTFDAMILNLKNVLLAEKDNRLENLIRKKFPIVFIDEFQDTDRVQFDIFNRLFIEHDTSILFLIGDPKQSIYSFRNADINSYLEAKSKVSHIYTMNTNFRSTEDMVAAVNEFYEAMGNSEAFGFDANTPEAKKIGYEMVNSNDKTGALYQHGEKVKEVLTLNSYYNNESVQRHLAARVSFMLDKQNGFQLYDKHIKSLRYLQPNDFGILVNSKNNGNKIKSLLQALNIPVVQLSDERVLQTPEAGEILHLYDAMLEPNIANIRKALYLSLLEPADQNDKGGWIFNIDENAALSLFSVYNQLLTGNNVYQAFYKLLEDFSVRSRFSNTTLGLRKLTNLEQIIHLMNDQQYQKGKDYSEIYLWLKKSINGFENEGDAYLVQLESDEDAVKISTIHISKGLEYNIVFIYGIHEKAVMRLPNKKEMQKYAWFEFKLENNPSRYFAQKYNISNEIENSILKSEEEEKARLIYVALTRAVFNCHVYFPYSSHIKVNYHGSVLNQYVNKIERINSPFIGIYSDQDTTSMSYLPSSDSLSINTITYNFNKASVSRSHWWKMSFSALTLHESELYDRQENLQEAYDQFVFNELPRGTDAGIALHTLFENLDFTLDYNNEASINWYYKRQFEVFNTQDDEVKIDFSKQVRQLVVQVLHAKIQFPNEMSFRLHDIADKQKLNELEFAFPVTLRKQAADLIHLLNTQDARIQISEQGLEGLMNGFIDLFFEYKGKYYILDWKSNYLGFTRDAYTFEKLQSAMKLSNYHLQYLIYTAAAYKFLKSRKSDFDYDRDFGGVIYVFLRGVRADSDIGIFTKKPAKKIIKQLLALLSQ